MKQLFHVQTKGLGYFYVVEDSESNAEKSVKFMLSMLHYGTPDDRAITKTRPVTSQINVWDKDTSRARVSMASNECRLLIP